MQIQYPKRCVLEFLEYRRIDKSRNPVIQSTLQYSEQALTEMPLLACHGWVVMTCGMVRTGTSISDKPSISLHCGKAELQCK
jgi:hypothetical protein